MHVPVYLGEALWLARFRGGLVFKAQSLCVTLNSRLESNKKKENPSEAGVGHDSERQIWCASRNIWPEQFGEPALLRIDPIIENIIKLLALSPGDGHREFTGSKRRVNDFKGFETF